MNVGLSSSTNSQSEFTHASIAFPRYTLRDLLIEVFYHKRIICIGFVVPAVLGLIAATMTKPSYVAQSRLLVLYGSEYFYRPVNGQSSNSSIPLDRNEIMLGELQVVESETLAMQTIKDVGLARVYPGSDPDNPAALPQAALRFEKDLTAGSIAQSNVLELSFRSYDPDVAADVLRALIKGYLERRVAVFGHPPSATVQSDQDTFQDRLRVAEGALAKFSDQHGIGNFEEQMTLLLTAQSSNRTASDDGAQAISEIAARLATVQKLGSKVAGTIQLSSETDRSQRVQLLTEEVTQLQIKQRALSTRYQPGAAPLEDVERNIASLQAQMGQGSARDAGVVHAGRNPLAQDVETQTLALQSQLAGLKAKQLQLDATSVSIGLRVKELTQSAQEYRDLQRNRDVLDQTFRALVRNNEDTQIADAAERSRAANIRVVQPPERPSVGRNLASVVVVSGIVVGIGAAIAGLALSYALRQVFVSVRDVTVTLELPVLVGIARGRGGATVKTDVPRPARTRWRKQALPETLGA